MRHGRIKDGIQDKIYGMRKVYKSIDQQLSETLKMAAEVKESENFLTALELVETDSANKNLLIACLNNAKGEE